VKDLIIASLPNHHILSLKTIASWKLLVRTYLRIKFLLGSASILSAASKMLVRTSVSYIACLQLLSVIRCMRF
jgi:hypothetical protein